VISTAFQIKTIAERDAIVSRNTIRVCMNPNENDFTRDEPNPLLGSTGGEQFRRAKEQVPTELSQTWDQTREKAGRALQRTEHFVRENPVPTILGALGLGIAIGLAIRYMAPAERKPEVEIESPWGKIDWSTLSLPFLWPLFKSARKKYEKSADAVADAMKDGVKRWKKMDVERYAKPIRKRWRAWTN
jgi:hypothetical protein